jgi:hypothetical protein
VHAPVPERSETRFPAEDASEMRLAGEAEGEGDLADRAVRVSERKPAGFDSPSADVFTYRRTERCAESGCQVHWMHPCFGCEIGEREAGGKAGVQCLAGAQQPRRAGASRSRLRDPSEFRAEGKDQPLERERRDSVRGPEFAERVLEEPPRPSPSPGERMVAI